MKRIRTAVIGIGYLGKYHAEKYARLPQSELVALCDIDHERCLTQAKALGVEAIADYRSLVNRIDAVSIVVPTLLHYTVGRFFLENGIHVLMEKPITTTLEEADELIALAKNNKVILQVGHLERFNNAIRAIEPRISKPLFIESVRLAPFKLRGSDVNVVLDLMIHDIDIIQSLVRSDIKHIAANGASILTPYIDIANARIEFANGCVANITASRVSLKTERKLRIFQHDTYVATDLDNKKISIHRKGTREMCPGIPEIVSEETAFDKGDALYDQIDSFLNAILHKKPSVVSGEDGRRALAIALEISLIVRRTNERHQLPEIVA